MTKEKNIDISMVIPALNEAEGIGPLVQRCTTFAKEVIVVDGASKDGTAEVAEKNGARVIVQPERGYGLAHRTGFEAAKCSIIAAADGDGTYPVEKIPEIAQRLIDEDLQFISCCRFPLITKSSMALTNRIGNQALSFIGSALWAHPFKDILSGMWVFRRSAFDQMDVQSKTWNFSQEIKIEAYTKFKNKFQEQAIPYFERVGTAKLSPWRVGAENLTYFLAHRFGLRNMINKK